MRVYHVMDMYNIETFKKQCKNNSLNQIDLYYIVSIANYHCNFDMFFFFCYDTQSVFISNLD